jgi:uncharacterized protein (DUF608 family)
MAKITRRRFLASAAVVAALNVKKNNREQTAEHADAADAQGGKALDGVSPSHITPYQTPLTPDGISGALNRLRESSDGKTPTEKRFTAEWVESLAARGEPTIYNRENSKDFAHIGMPVGGIGAGQLYIGGDGKLWWWDIFNSKTNGGSIGNYLNAPVESNSRDEGQLVLAQGFAIRYRKDDANVVRTLDKKGFKNILFRGQYPIAHVTYADVGDPVKVELEAFSPFIPLDLENSSYPAVMLNYTIHNTSDSSLECELAGWLENAVCIKSRSNYQAALKNMIHQTDAADILECSVVPTAKLATGQTRPDIVFEDFNGGTYKNWKVRGRAFGKTPSTIDTNPRAAWDRPVLARTMLGKYMADSFHNGGNVTINGDSATGSLISPLFTITRPFINVHLAGGDHPGETCVNLVVNGKVVRTMTGENSDSLTWQSWDVQTLVGQQAHIELVDRATGEWGHIEVDRIVLSEFPAGTFEGLRKTVDFGTIALAVLGEKGKAIGSCDIQFTDLPEAAFANAPKAATADMQQGIVGSIGRRVKIAPGKSRTISFILAWHFPNPIPLGLKTPSGRWYGEAFSSATQVTGYLIQRVGSLTSQTRLWRDTWYNSTLPHWLLERAMFNTSTLSTATSYLFSDGRFYAWEGVYCCVGTCTHVYGYTIAPALLFPTLEKRLREMVDFNPRIGFNKDGGVGMRGEFERLPAVDGQAGIILRTLRTHQMCPDNSFLKRHYASVLKATEYLIKVNDPRRTGILSGAQNNTLDAAWYGSSAWLSIYYQAALHAMAAMANDMADHRKAAELQSIAGRGRAFAEKQLFNGQYFYQLHDKTHPDALGSYAGCEIDQLLGQSLAFQAGLGGIIDLPQASAALESLWRNNFTTNVGLYRKAYPVGRWFAAGHDAGTIMCTWPRGHTKTSGWQAGYFNECQSGFEHALASLMIWHGFVDRGLAIIRAIHDRYSADKRNPYNEIECSGHYGRAMASYGVFTAVCGYEHHGPRGYLAFAPRLSPENFRAAFTVSEGWGTYHQKFFNGRGSAGLVLRWGRLKLKALCLQCGGAAATTPAVHVSLAGEKLSATIQASGERLIILLRKAKTLTAGQELLVRID